ncbi:MAG: hypothetical protein A3A02_01135 [Candidatus Buchananbacteria bacterium RIFCSPLOWO2_01_FULL_39_33]|uniref:Uncharacterized protein n=1 Tax=Candidatus Buchananbacteria bacterium RIFCSPLOWO2_01_FULL_39_33 TaxID=1797543 RepID=A0A1G1YFU9_9BACT|nr:MAG: hypothetical protein A3A02_01135 [Candidatus Buchananbacteria bacterium RIFCSPLOWO2_01_FULL_39_33]
MSEQITKEKYMADKRADINNYENLLKAVLALKKYFEEEKNAQFYFGGHLINSQKKENPNYKGDTPDIIVETSSKSLLGEAKKSLPDPSTFVSKEQYIKSVIENKIMAQLKKYDADFENLKIKDHDVFLLVPEHNNDALGILKFDYLDKDKHFQNKFFLLVYNIGLLANTKSIMVKLDYGECSDSLLLDKLKRAIRYNEGDLAKELAKFKIFEENENSTPVEYILTILWTSIIPEILKANDKEQILERYAKKENKFTVKLSSLMDYLNKLYTLPTYPKSDIMHHNDRNQFKTKPVKDAMKILIKVGLATELQKENSDVSWEIHHKPLPEKDEMNYFIGKSYETLNERKEIDATGIEKLDKFMK